MTDRERLLEWQPMEQNWMSLAEWTRRGEKIEGVYTTAGETVKGHAGVMCPYCRSAMIQAQGAIFRIGHIVEVGAGRVSYMVDRLPPSHVALYWPNDR